MTDRREVVLASYGLTLARGLAALLLVTLVVATVVLPTFLNGVAQEFLALPAGSETGSGIGCAAAAAVNGGVLALVTRRPSVPSATLLVVLTRQLTPVWLIFAPMGPCTDHIASRPLAVAVAVPIGLALWLGGWLFFRRVINTPGETA